MIKANRIWINKRLLVQQALKAWMVIGIGGFIFATMSVLLSVYGVKKEESISIPLIITGVSILVIHVSLYRYENRQAKRMEGEKAVKILQKEGHSQNVEDMEIKPNLLTMEEIKRMVEVYSKRFPTSIDSTEPIVTIGWGRTISKELHPLVAA